MTRLSQVAREERAYVTHLLGVVVVTSLSILAITVLAAFERTVPDVLVVIVTGGISYLLGNVSGAKAAEAREQRNGNGSKE